MVRGVDFLAGGRDMATPRSRARSVLANSASGSSPACTEWSVQAPVSGSLNLIR